MLIFNNLLFYLGVNYIPWRSCHIVLSNQKLYPKESLRFLICIKFALLPFHLNAKLKLYLHVMKLLFFREKHIKLIKLQFVVFIRNKIFKFFSFLKFKWKLSAQVNNGVINAIKMHLNNFFMSSAFRLKIVFV